MILKETEKLLYCVRSVHAHTNYTIVIEDFSVSFIFRTNCLELGERMELLRKTVSGIVLMLLLTSMLSSAFIIQPVKAEPTTWTVDDDLQDYPDADFRKIQDAVNVATDGDTILVYPGTYNENVDVNKSLTLNQNTALIQRLFKQQTQMIMFLR